MRCRKMKKFMRFMEMMNMWKKPGMGMGMDRLAKLLTGAATLRDVILFPTLKKR